MTRRTDIAREYDLAVALAQELKRHGYWRYSGLRWRNDTKILDRLDLANLCQSWHPEITDMGAYLRSRRFHYNLAFLDHTLTS